MEGTIRLEDSLPPASAIKSEGTWCVVGKDSNTPVGGRGVAYREDRKGTTCGYLCATGCMSWAGDLEIREGVQVDVPDQPSRRRGQGHDFGCDAVVVRSRTQDHGGHPRERPWLEVIGRAGTGIDNIDSGSEFEGHSVMNTPGANSMSAAEQTMAMMLSLARHGAPGDSVHERGGWKEAFHGHRALPPDPGIIGLGKIGSIVADRALAMKMDVLAHDPHILPKPPLYSESIGLPGRAPRPVRFHHPHTPSTPDRGSSTGRPWPHEGGVRIINCARGDLVDEEALHACLVSGHVAGAALDVFAQEPPTESLFSS